MRALAIIAAVAALAAGPAAAEPLRVPIDQSARLTLPGSARDVIIGNPAVLDVTVLDARNLVVQGKGFGVTNLLVVDAAGRTLLQRDVVVTSPDSGQVSFYRGGQALTYACSPRCEPAVARGGDTGPSAP